MDGLAADLQARAVGGQGYRSLWRTIDLLSDRRRGMASRQRRVIGARKRHAHQRQDGVKKALGLTQGEAKK